MSNSARHSKKSKLPSKRKQETLDQINSKLANLNKEMEAVKKAENMSETERAIRVRFLQKQINIIFEF